MTGKLNTPTSVCCTAFGVPFRLAAKTGLLLRKMLAVTPLGTELSESPQYPVQQFTLALNPEARGSCISGSGSIAEAVKLDQALEQLARDLMMYVANHAPDCVFLHAGVVAKSGCALLLPGKSFAGKTTLVAELVRAGATYYSDEYAVLDNHGWVHPYPRELKMRRPGRPEQTAVAVEALNGTAGATPLPVSQVVFAQYSLSAEWLPEPVSPAMAILEMLRHAIPVQRTPARVMATLARMMETATASRSCRGEARPVAASLLAMLDSGAKPRLDPAPAPAPMLVPVEVSP